MILGYLLMAVIAVGFFIVGIKSFTSKGLPLTRRKNLTGSPARIAGVICHVFGLGIIGAGIYDYFVIHAPVVNPVIPTQNPEQKRNINEYGPAEYGHELEKMSVDEGFISLFDGKTTFGWSGAKVEKGDLVNGTNTTVFKAGLNLNVSRPGKLILNGEKRHLKKGGVIVFGPQSPGPIALDGGIALEKILVRPSLLKIDFRRWKLVQDPKRPKGSEPKWEIRDNVLHVSGGSGVLEYGSARFGDFILQADVKTKNRHAKGALLIRSQPGSFKTGYEIPIYNSCVGNDIAKPCPSSTGAIAGHQKPRRLVSRDGDFFTLTIIAHDNHFATWVNGYQQTDWTDMRLKNDNAQLGLRIESGTIQLWIDPESAVEF